MKWMSGGKKRQCDRTLGTILKPAASALRVERYYKPAPFGGREIWTAVTSPAGSADSTSDARANSLARLGEPVKGGNATAVWWWSLLSTQVDGSLPSGAPLQLAELWPKPAKGTSLLVFKPQSTSPAGGNHPGPGKPCVNGSIASSWARWPAPHCGCGQSERGQAAPQLPAVDAPRAVREAPCSTPHTLSHGTVVHATREAPCSAPQHPPVWWGGAHH